MDPQVPIFPSTVQQDFSPSKKVPLGNPDDDPAAGNWWKAAAALKLLPMLLDEADAEIGNGNGYGNDGKSSFSSLVERSFRSLKLAAISRREKIRCLRGMQIMSTLMN